MLAKDDKYRLLMGTVIDKKFRKASSYVCDVRILPRFDRGFGPGVVRSKTSVVEGHWNRVRIHCDNWNGYVQLNDGPVAKGKPKVRSYIQGGPQNWHTLFCTP